MWIDGGIVFLFGLVIGSFLNVCIYRIPRGESVVKPRSKCPHCGKMISALENIPVLSYLLQGGKCRSCGQEISWVYPVVELLTGLSLLLLYTRYHFEPAFFLNALFVCLTIVLIFVDLFDRILPDVVTLGGAITGFLLAPLQSAEFLQGQLFYNFENPIVQSYLNSLLGILLGGGFLWAVAFLYFKVRKVEGMGFGDVKMMAFVGAFLGWKHVWLTILLGSLLGALLGALFISLFRKGRQYELPFGSFLGVAAIVVVLYGPAILRWYLSTVLTS